MKDHLFPQAKQQEEVEAESEAAVGEVHRNS